MILKDIAEKIRQEDGHYVLALKGNQGKFHEGVKSYMLEEGTALSNLILDGIDDSHGRSVRRRYFATEVPKSLVSNGFKDLKTLIATETISQRGAGSPVTAEWRYYITDHDRNNEKLAEYIRGHWGVENKLHWILDVHLNDDHDKKLDRNAADNFSRIKRLLLNLVRKNDADSKLSVGRKLKKMLWDENYFTKIITG
jgi:predicted transposase YbfD/YdcC